MKYVQTQPGYLCTRCKPASTPTVWYKHTIGVIILVISPIVNPFLTWTKYNNGKNLESKELKADAKDTFVLSAYLNNEFGKGFSATNLKQMRSFFLTYSKGQTVSDEFNLSGSHYLKGTSNNIKLAIKEN